jgi:hypothetical protein
MPDQAERLAREIRIMDAQVAQGWTTATTEMLSRRFFESCNQDAAYASFVEDRAADVMTAAERSSWQPDTSWDASARILRAQIAAGWSETTLDLTARDFMRDRDLLGDFADFLEAQAAEENAMSGGCNGGWDDDTDIDDPEDDDLEPQ